MLEEILIKFEELFASSPLIGLVISFLAGILASISACIYPLVPITLAIIGAVSASTKFKGFFISCIFVSGIALVYTFLGVVASVSHILLANFFINPVTYIILSVIFIFLGLDLFELIKVNIPVFSFNYEYKSKKGLISVFVLGMISAFSMIPCNFPVLFSILNLISQRANVAYGSLALFLFSTGYGLILIILGTFSSLIRRLPKQGIWTILLKKIIGAVLTGVGIWYFLKFLNTVN